MVDETQNITLDCGIPYARLTAWLDDELTLSRADDGLWTFACEKAPDDSQARVASTCQVGLTRLEDRALSNFALEHTQITIDGDAAAVATLMKLFTLRFISAGG